MISVLHFSQQCVWDLLKIYVNMSYPAIGIEIGHNVTHFKFLFVSLSCLWFVLIFNLCVRNWELGYLTVKPFPDEQKSCLKFRYYQQSSLKIKEEIMMPLPIKYGVKTSILLFYWRYIWASLSNLVFNEYYFQYDIKLSGVVDYVLSLHYKVYSSLFSCHELQHHHLFDCTIILPRNFKGFDKLKTLQLTCTIIFDDKLSSLVSISTQLQNLEECCYASITLSTNVKRKCNWYQFLKCVNFLCIWNFLSVSFLCLKIPEALARLSGVRISPNGLKNFTFNCPQLKELQLQLIDFHDLSIWVLTQKVFNV